MRFGVFVTGAALLIAGFFGLVVARDSVIQVISVAVLIAGTTLSVTGWITRVVAAEPEDAALAEIPRPHPEFPAAQFPAAQIACSECGELNPRTNSICWHCGHALR